MCVADTDSSALPQVFNSVIDWYVFGEIYLQGFLPNSFYKKIVIDFLKLRE